MQESWRFDAVDEEEGSCIWKESRDVSRIKSDVVGCDTGRNRQSQNLRKLNNIGHRDFSAG